MDLGPYLTAHGFLRVERPPTLWEVDCDDEAMLQVWGEMIAAALARGTDLGDVVLRVNNVEIGDDGPPAPGEYVAVSVLGEGNWEPEVSWSATGAGSVVLMNDSLDRAARALGVPWAYTRDFGGHGSVTILLPRHRPV